MTQTLAETQLSKSAEAIPIKNKLTYTFEDDVLGECKITILKDISINNISYEVALNGIDRSCIYEIQSLINQECFDWDVSRLSLIGRSEGVFCKYSYAPKKGVYRNEDKNAERILTEGIQNLKSIISDINKIWDRKEF